MKDSKNVRAAAKLQQQFAASFPGQITDLRWLVLLRHGETDLNVARRIAGSLQEQDYGAELTAGARRAARHNALELRIIERAVGGFEHLLVSPLNRAIETADLVLAELESPSDLVRLDGLKERGMGGLVLRPKALHPAFFTDPSATPPLDGCITDGSPESFETFVKRVHSCFDTEVASRLRTGNMVITSHQYVTSALQGHLFRWSNLEMMSVGHAIPNCAPLVLGLHKETLEPVPTGLCVLRAPL
jgi:broad specificity phosphatase PhoE